MKGQLGKALDAGARNGNTMMALAFIRVFCATALLWVPLELHAEDSKTSEDTKDDPHQVDDIVVTGSRTEQRLSDAPVATEVIRREDVETSGAEDVADLLASHTGIDLNQSFRGTSVRLQGLDAKHVLILVDGERLTGRIEGVIDLRRFLVEDIDHIEIVKGASSALYGSDAVGGVINIITKKAEAPLEAQLHASYGSFNATDLSGMFALSNAAWNTRTSGGWHRVDAYDLDAADEASSGSAISEFNFANKTAYKFNDAFRLVGTVDYLQRDMQGVDSNASGAVFDRRNMTETFSATIKPEMKMPGTSKFGVSAHYSLFRDQFLYDQRKSDALDQYQETLEQLSQLTMQYDRLLTAQHMFTMGIIANYESLASERLENNVGDRFRGGVFVQDEWTLFDTPLLVLVPGVRYDFDSQFGSYPTPKLTLRCDPVEKLVLRASYGTGYRAPVFKELLLLFENPSVGYVVAGNPDLLPETSQSVNVGGEWWPVNWLWLTLNIFHNDIDNLITTNSGVDVGGVTQFQYGNIAAARTQGLEASLRFPIGSFVSFKTGYTLTDTLDETAGRAIEGRALHRVTFDLRFRHKSWGSEGTLRGNLVGERPFYAKPNGEIFEQTVIAQPYSNMDLRIGQKLFEKTTLFFGIENILDAGEADFLPIQPRTFYGGITQRL